MEAKKELYRQLNPDEIIKDTKKRKRKDMEEETSYDQVIEEFQFED